MTGYGGLERSERGERSGRDPRAASRRAVLRGAVALGVGIPALGPVVADAAEAFKPGYLRKNLKLAANAANRGRAAKAAVNPVEPSSTAFATASIGYFEDLDTESDGDLWPTAWADDGNLYTANGDGKGFDLTKPWVDIVVNRVDGTPESGISGVRLADGDRVGKVWSDPNLYNRKPTGMVAVDGNGDGKDELYLAIQDLRKGDKAFDDAPAASISKSTDYGRTWVSTDKPMFDKYFFTTIIFLDFGQSNKNAAVLGPDGTKYVYAYGLDNNWRDSFSGTVEDPVDLYLARVPIASIQDASTWQFFAGEIAGKPTWSTDRNRRKAVLHDDRRVYPELRGPKGPTNMSVLSQGSVTYNAPLKRYVYCSWTEYTFEFYEAKKPWGPWKLFMTKDFGPYPWWGREGGCATPKNGGYGVVIPSKFISADGRRMWANANWFSGDIPCGKPNYNFSLRKVDVTPYRPTVPRNRPDPKANLAREAGTVPLDKTSHYGKIAYLNDGNRQLGEDSWDATPKTIDRWGFVWPKSYYFDRVVYTTGKAFTDGGWFSAGLRVQVRRNFRWIDVPAKVDPPYPHDASANPFKTFTFTFPRTWGDGVRVIGTPGGGQNFTSIAELEVFFAGGASGVKR